MPLIKFDVLIKDLTNDSFERVKYRINRYLSYYFTNGEDADRRMLLEKLGSFLEHFEQYNNKRDNDLAKTYVDWLFKYINYRIDEKGRANAYFLRAKKIRDDINTYDTSELLDKLEDFTKIFICLYYEYVKHHDIPISNFRFYVSGCDIDAIIKTLEQDIPELSPNEKKGKAIINFIPKEVRTAANDTFKMVADTINNPKRTHIQDEVFEPIHDVIEQNENKPCYTEENYCFILLSVFYRRILDFETEMVG